MPLVVHAGFCPKLKAVGNQRDTDDTKSVDRDIRPILKAATVDVTSFELDLRRLTCVRPHFGQSLLQAA
jgi:hypothetical protein